MARSIRISMVTLTVLVVAVALIPTVSAHKAGLEPGYTRLLYDCSHDWGWESGKPLDRGHDLVQLTVIEREEEGQPLVIFRLNMVKVTLEEDDYGAPYQTWETLTITGPRTTVETRIQTTAEEGPALYDAGEVPAYRGDRELQVSSAGGIDSFSISYDLGYTYEQLQIQQGETLKAVSVRGYAENVVGARQAADLMAGGYRDWATGNDFKGCRNAPGNDPAQDEHYRNEPDAYVFQHSDWTVPEPVYQPQDPPVSPSPPSGYQGHDQPAGGDEPVGQDDAQDEPEEPVNRPPIAEFSRSPANATAGQVIIFSDGSFDPDGVVTNWTWALGDGTTSYAREPRHTYAQAGDYQVSLTVRDDQDQTNTTSKIVKILEAIAPKDENAEGQAPADSSGTNPDNSTAAGQAEENQRPVAGLTIFPSRPAAGARVEFHDGSYDPDGTIRAWHWTLSHMEQDPRDLTTVVTSGKRAFVHTFAHPGTYLIHLTVVDDQGAQASVEEAFTVQPANPPVADFRVHWPHEPRAGSNATLMDASTRGGAGIVAWRWTIEGANLTGKNVSHAFTQPGRYIVSLTVEDANGASASVAKEVLVPNQAPWASFEIPVGQLMAGKAIKLRSTAEDPDGTIIAWDWFLGEAGTASGPAVEHIFDRPGNHTISLTVTDSSGMTNTTRQTVEVGADESLARLSQGGDAGGQEVPFVPLWAVLLAVLSVGVLRAGRQR